MTYDKHRAEMHKMLAEFERVTGTGNMKNANLAMIKMIKSLVAMIETQPKSGGCGGNCKCSPKPFTPPVTPFTPVAPFPEKVPVAPVVEAETKFIAEPEMQIEPEVVEPAVVEEVAPILAEPIAEVVAESLVEPVAEVVEPVAELPVADDVAEAETTTDDAPKPVRKGKKPV